MGEEKIYGFKMVFEHYNQNSTFINDNQVSTEMSLHNLCDGKYDADSCTAETLVIFLLFYKLF